MFKFIENIYNKRELLFTLVDKEIKIRYKQSIMGPLWALFYPLALLGFFIMVEKFTHIKSENIPYPAFVYSALLPWIFFSNAVTFSSVSLVHNASIIKKISCPRELFPLAAVLARFFDFAVALILFIPIILYYHIPITIYIVFLPLFIIIQIILTIGVSLITSSLAVYRRDIVIAIPFIMQFWMFASPVMYSINSVPEKWKTLYSLNPITGLIEAYRNLIIYGKLPGLNLLLYTIIGSFVLFAIGLFIFAKLEKGFADAV